MAASGCVPVIDKSLYLLASERQVIRALLGQAGLGFVIGAALAIMQGLIVGTSWLLGVLVALVPNAFLAARLLGSKVEAKAILRAAWIGEIGKFALTVLLFGAIFAWVKTLSVLAVFGGFIAAQIVTIGILALGGQTGKAQVETKN